MACGVVGGKEFSNVFSFFHFFQRRERKTSPGRRFLPSLLHRKHDRRDPREFVVTSFSNLTHHSERNSNKFSFSFFIPFQSSCLIFLSQKCKRNKKIKYKGARNEVLHCARMDQKSFDEAEQFPYCDVFNRYFILITENMDNLNWKAKKQKKMGG